MQHTCYHLVSDHNSQFISDLKEVRTTVDKWNNEGETHITIFRIMTEELDSDAINLEEKQLSNEEIYTN